MSFGDDAQRNPRTRRLAALAACGLASFPAPAAPTAPAAPAPVLQVPASFAGDLPCAGCADARAQLDLWADGTFHLRRRGALDDPAQADQIGRWRRDPVAPEVLLYGGHEAPLRLRIVDQHTLQGLGAPPRGTTAGPNGTLASEGGLRPADLALRLHGMVRLDGDAATFAECLTGRSYPIAMEQDATALERDLRALPVGLAGTPMLASFDGAIVQPTAAAAPVVIVHRLAGLWPGQSCERAMSYASLSNQYWRLGQLQGRPVQAFVSERETYVILREAGGYVANAGCGRFAGGYRVEGTEITFDAPPLPLPGCPAHLDARQQQLTAALAAARHWAIQGQVLELFDAHRLSLIAFEAIYLR